jgi:hypothetical protein
MKLSALLGQVGSAIEIALGEILLGGENDVLLGGQAVVFCVVSLTARRMDQPCRARWSGRSIGAQALDYIRSALG